MISRILASRVPRQQVPAPRSGRGSRFFRAVVARGNAPRDAVLVAASPGRQRGVGAGVFDEQSLSHPLEHCDCSIGRAAFRGRSTHRTSHAFGATGINVNDLGSLIGQALSLDRRNPGLQKRPQILGNASRTGQTDVVGIEVERLATGAYCAFAGPTQRIGRIE